MHAAAHRSNVEVVSGVYAWNEDMPGAEIVAGKGTAMPTPNAMAEARKRMVELGIEGGVTFAGPYPQAQAPGLHRRATLLLHCKYNDPSPGLVVEALACGLPVVYSATGGVPELVGDAGVGVPSDVSWERVIPPDPDLMAEAVLETAERQPQLADLAGQRAVERFALGPWLARHQEILEAALRGVAVEDRGSGAALARRTGPQVHGTSADVKRLMPSDQLRDGKTPAAR